MTERQIIADTWQVAGYLVGFVMFAAVLLLGFALLREITR